MSWTLKAGPGGVEGGGLSLEKPRISQGQALCRVLGLNKGFCGWTKSILHHLRKPWVMLPL